jgi:hypothetical protein
MTITLRAILITQRNAHRLRRRIPMAQIATETSTGTGTEMKKIVVRKAGAVRLTRLCNNYCYGMCCCAEFLG